MVEKFTSRLKKLFFHPKKFFDSVEKDKDYSKIIFFYVKIVVFSAVLSLIFSLINSGISAVTIFNTVTILITNIGLAFLIPFVAAGITHLGVLIFRGRQKYFNTYKPVAYTLAIASVYSILSSVINFIVTLASPVDITALSANPELMLQNQTVIISLIVFLVIFLISFIHVLIAQVIGISKFQKISKLRAFFAVILIPLIILILAIILVAYAINNLPIDALAG